MRRRDTLIALLCLAGLPVRAAAPTNGNWRVGILSIRSRPPNLEDDYVYGPFLKGMRELGYVEGKNLAIHWRFAAGAYERLPALAEELVRAKVDAIVVINVPVVRAAQRATSTIPIVLMSSSDPVASGFVRSLSRPGGNVTGISNTSVDLSGKSLDVLRRVVPRLAGILFLMNPRNGNHEIFLKKLREEAQKLDIEVTPAPWNGKTVLDEAIKVPVNSKGPVALAVASDSYFRDLAPQITDWEVRHRLPAIYPDRQYVLAGGLMSYGENYQDGYRYAATYIDKIFHGAKPSELPVETPTRIELMVNTRVAKALGITMPPDIVMLADQVVD